MSDFEEKDRRATVWYATVRALCKADAARSMVEMALDGSCVVYFVQESGMGAVKIGATANMKSRLNMLRSNSPHEVSVLDRVPGDERLEAYLHDLFRDSHIRGEWFRPTPELFAMIEELKSGPLVLSSSEQKLIDEAVKTWTAPFAPRPNRKRVRRDRDDGERWQAVGLIDEALKRREARHFHEETGKKNGVEEKSPD